MISVVFATYNGANTLPNTLESFTKLQHPEGGWKLVAVDNSSTDTTLNILRHFSDRLPLEVLVQPRRGKNAALNMAIPQFEGDLVVFTDDDVIPMSSWLTSYVELARQHLECDVFGGRIVPHWPGPPPEEIIKSIPMGPAFAVHPPDMSEGSVNPGMIWGANMAVRRKVFAAGHRFNEDVGPASGNYMMGSETEFIHRLSAEGHAVWFTNDITVKHQILEHQLTSKWLWHRAKQFGKGLGRSQAAAEKPYGALLFGLPRWRVGQLLLSASELSHGMLTQNRAQRMSALWRLGLHYGALFGKL